MTVMLYRSQALPGDAQNMTLTQPAIHQHRILHKVPTTAYNKTAIPHPSAPLIQNNVITAHPSHAAARRNVQCPHALGHLRHRTLLAACDQALRDPASDTASA